MDFVSLNNPKNGEMTVLNEVATAKIPLLNRNANFYIYIFARTRLHLQYEKL